MMLIAADCSAMAVGHEKLQRAMRNGMTSSSTYVNPERVDNGDGMLPDSRLVCSRNALGVQPKVDMCQRTRKMIASATCRQ